MYTPCRSPGIVKVWGIPMSIDASEWGPHGPLYPPKTVYTFSRAASNRTLLKGAFTEVWPENLLVPVCYCSNEGISLVGMATDCACRY
jgi:hypothetical protein